MSGDMLWQKFKSKPVQVVQFDGTSACIEDIRHWMSTGVWHKRAVRTRDIRSVDLLVSMRDGDRMGYVRVEAGDWLVKVGDFGGASDFVVYRASEFASTFESVDEKIGCDISTDDGVEFLAKMCGWDNRRYMTPADYAIWAQRMREFVELARKSKS